MAAVGGEKSVRLCSVTFIDSLTLSQIIVTPSETLITLVKSGREICHVHVSTWRWKRQTFVLHPMWFIGFDHFVPPHESDFTTLLSCSSASAGRWGLLNCNFHFKAHFGGRYVYSQQQKWRSVQFYIYFVCLDSFRKVRKRRYSYFYAAVWLLTALCFCQSEICHQHAVCICFLIQSLCLYQCLSSNIMLQDSFSFNRLPTCSTLNVLIWFLLWI